MAAKKKNIKNTTVEELLMQATNTQINIALKEQLDDLVTNALDSGDIHDLLSNAVWKSAKAFLKENKKTIDEEVKATIKSIIDDMNVDVVVDRLF